MTANRVIRWTAAGAVVGVAAIAAVASYDHAYDLVRTHGETGWTARLVPLTVDGLIYASSMVMLDSARAKRPVPALARWLLGLGIAATLAANVAHGLSRGLIGAAVAAWPAVALVGSYELLMMIIRYAQAPAQLLGSDSASSHAERCRSVAGASRAGVRQRPGGQSSSFGARHPLAASRRSAPRPASTRISHRPHRWLGEGVGEALCRALQDSCMRVRAGSSRGHAKVQEPMPVRTSAGVLDEMRPMGG